MDKSQEYIPASERANNPLQDKRNIDTWDDKSSPALQKLVHELQSDARRTEVAHPNQLKALPGRDQPVPMNRTPYERPEKSEKSDRPMERGEQVKVAAELLLKVHAGKATEATEELRHLKPADARAVADFMKTINRKAEESRGWFDAHVPQIHITYTPDRNGGKDLPSEVREATPQEVLDDRHTDSLFERGKVSDQFARSVEEAIAGLPASVRRELAQQGYKFAAANTVTERFPVLKGQHPRGYGKDDTFDNCPALTMGNTCVVAEHSRVGKEEVTNTDPSNGVRHEGAHAFDADLKGFSDSDEFKRAYASDTAGIKPEDRAYLAYFLQPDSAGRQETFAEVFATLYGGSSNRYFREKMAQSFPECAKVIMAKLRALESN